MDNGGIREIPSAEEWALGDPIPFRGRIRDGAEPAAFEIPAAVVPGIARICSLGLGMDELLGETCRVIVGLCGVDACYLVSYRERDGGAEVHHFAGSGDWPDLRAVYGSDPRWDAALGNLRDHGILAADDVLSLPPDDPVRVLHEPHSVRSLLLAPLKFGTGLVGLLALHGYGAPRKWGEEDSRIAGSVASILSAALERRRVEERLRASEARYRFLADHALDFISLIDASGKVLFASPSAHRMLGYRPEEMVGRGSESFLPPEDREGMGEAVGRLVAGEAPSVTMQHRFRKKDGGFAEVETVSSAVPGSPGEAPRVLRISRDITQRNAMESRLFESQKMETIGMLAGGVAHEFNNLLLGITGTAEMLSLLLAGNQEAAGYLAIIDRMGSRAAELTRQLLAYSGQGKHRPELLSINRIVEEQIPVLRTALPPSVEVALELAREVPPVLADVLQMKQVIMSLCLNAAEAMPDGGVLTLRTRTEENPPDGPSRGGSGGNRAERTVGSGGFFPGAGTRTVLEVSDTGSGMDAETVSRIFEPFFSTKFIGRGLGLAAVRGIVEGHEGSIRVTSEAGKGTTFALSFPAVAGEAPAAERRETFPVCGTGTILVADDEEDVRAMVRAMLESFGYRVLEARDGKEAVDLYRERNGQINLVLLDMMMPRMTGEQAFAEMRRISPSARAVLASGYDDRGRIAEVLASGFSGFLQKPFRRRELGQKVSEALGIAVPEEASNGI
ncbi:MAG: hybrid sensor histidine kinase/response regulator [Candidatus Deferrimicrobiaceae bacterium]